MGLNECNSCKGSFPLHGYVDYKVSQTCRQCNMRSSLEDKLATITLHAEELTRRVNALEDFVSQNIASETTSALSPVIWPSISPVISRTSSSTPNASPVITPSTRKNDRHSQFQVVKNGFKPITKRILPVKTYNKFQILEDVAEDTYETRICGDSITSPLLEEFVGRSPKTRKRYCMPGGGINDIIAAREEVTDGASKDTLFIMHVGTNDVKKTRSEELLQKYRELIEQYKMKSRNIMISGILPRISAENVFYSKAFSLNSRLNSLCRKEGVTFINTWDHFFNKPELFAKDGLHLNCVGAARFGRLLNEEVREFWSKNEIRVIPTDTET